MTDEFMKACEFAGIEATKRQWRRWCRKEGLAYRLSRHFDPIHEERRALNVEIDVRNDARNRENKRRAEVNKVVTNPAEHLPMEPMEERHPVPATRDEIRAWLNETSAAGVGSRDVLTRMAA